MVHLLEDIEKYALEKNVPIMQKEGIEFSSAVLSLMIIVTLIVFSVLAATF